MRRWAPAEGAESEREGIKIAGILGPLNHEKIILVMMTILFVAFLLILPKFLQSTNVLALVRSGVIFDILSLGTLVVVLAHLVGRQSPGRRRDRRVIA